MDTSNENVPLAWALGPDELLAHHGVSAQAGLSDADAERRLQQYGVNEVVQTVQRGALSILVDQLKSVVVLLLVGATLMSFALGDVTEGLAILVVIVLNTALGFFTELKAYRSMDALRALGRATTVVRRSGRVQSVPAERLVPGDIVILEAGDVVSADLRLIGGTHVAADESALTGESVPVPKHLDPVAASAHISDRACVLHRGTVLTRGQAEAVVFATGRATQVGHIATLVDHAKAAATPLEKRLASLGQRLVWLTLVLVVMMNVLALATGRDPGLMIKTSVALAVAAIPEGLPVVATLALARGMWRMAARNALISRLTAVETLGTTSVVLTDKTGTLTENRMGVQRVAVAQGGDAQEFECDDETGQDALTALVEHPLVAVAALCNNASLDSDPPTGDPTEIALLEFARQCGFRRADRLAALPQVAQEPFDSARQMMATVHRGDDDHWVAVKGSPEAVMAHCAHVAGHASGPVPLDETVRRAWLTRAADMAAQGLRVLAIASKRAATADADVYSSLTLIGLVGMWDPPREDVADAIARLRGAGIRVVMVTGDHPATASHVARAVGIVDSDQHDCIDGRDYESAATLPAVEQARLIETRVIARSSPRQKLELIELHQRAGQVVAMTGDGVNDAPALKRADIGIAMGIRGTAVARQAAAMILRDDQLGTIVEAVRYGRVVFANIRRFVLYLMSCNLSEILVVALAMFSGAPLPLTPLQILFLNLVTDVFPALALGVTRADPGVLEQRPRSSSEPLLTREKWIALVLYGLTICAVVLLVLRLGMTRFGLQGDELTTATFTTLALAQIWHVFNMRDRSAGWRAATLRNRYVWGAVVLCVVLIALAMIVPPVASALALVPLPLPVWGLVGALSLVPLLVGGGVARLAGWLARLGRSTAVASGTSRTPG